MTDKAEPPREVVFLLDGEATEIVTSENDPHGRNSTPVPLDDLDPEAQDIVVTVEEFATILRRLLNAMGRRNSESNGQRGNLHGLLGSASEEAIASLPKKNLDEKMSGPELKAKCSVCMDDVTVGDEVVVLPCTHWFHEACATAWLKEHNTCPICRTGIGGKQPPPTPERASQDGPPNIWLFPTLERSTRRYHIMNDSGVEVAVVGYESDEGSYESDEGSYTGSYIE